MYREVVRYVHRWTFLNERYFLVEVSYVNRSWQFSFSQNWEPLCFKWHMHAQHSDTMLWDFNYIFYLLKFNRLVLPSRFWKWTRTNLSKLPAWVFKVWQAWKFSSLSAIRSSIWWTVPFSDWRALKSFIWIEIVWKQSEKVCNLFILIIWWIMDKLEDTDVSLTLGQYIWRTKCHSGTKYFVLETKFWPENLSSKMRPKNSSSFFEDEILRTDFLRTKCFEDKLLLRTKWFNALAISTGCSWPLPALTSSL